MSVLLFDYTGSAIKNTVNNFRPKPVVSQKTDIKKKKKDFF